MSEGAYGKIDALKKVPTVRQVLSGNVFLNFQHLHPEFQMFILRHIQSHYVANISLILVCFGRTQQLLSSTLSVFWGIGISCLIDYFQNDIDKIVNAFYPIFKKWVQLDYHNLKKLSDL